MNLSPTVRWLLGAVAAGVAALGALLPTLTDVPTWVGVVVAVVGAVLAALGIVPPQVGGTQQGVVNPSVTEQPGANAVIGGPGYVGGTLPEPGSTPTGNRGVSAFAPIALLFGQRNEVSEGEALFWIGVLIVVLCIATALWLVVRMREYIGAVVCLVIAVIAAVLLL